MNWIIKACYAIYRAIFHLDLYPAQTNDWPPESEPQPHGYVDQD